MLKWFHICLNSEEKWLYFMPGVCLSSVSEPRSRKRFHKYSAVINYLNSGIWPIHIKWDRIICGRRICMKTDGHDNRHSYRHRPPWLINCGRYSCVPRQVSNALNAAYCWAVKQLCDVVLWFFAGVCWTVTIPLCTNVREERLLLLTPQAFIHSLFPLIK